MLRDICSVLLLLFMLRRSSGDSVTQTEGLVTVTEGLPMMMNCTYQSTYSAPVVFWYVQYLHKAPQLLLKSFTDNQRTEHQGFQATLHKSSSSFHLQKSSVQLADSALYYCALSDTVRETAGEAAHKPRVQDAEGRGPVMEGCVPSLSGVYQPSENGNKSQNKVVRHDRQIGSNLSQKVTQDQSTASTQEGEEVTLDCSYETSQKLYHLFWYKQLLSGEMIFLIRQISYSTKIERSSRYSVVFQKSAKSISLVISASQLEDSVKYFCALWEQDNPQCLK
ncbi:hypothetical protein STEG23_025903 [Scotinomys teguina]